MDRLHRTNFRIEFGEPFPEPREIRRITTEHGGIYDAEIVRAYDHEWTYENGVVTGITCKVTYFINQVIRADPHLKLIYNRNLEE